MSRPKREPRAVTVAEIEKHFKLASYWFGEKWCPAVHKTAIGYGIRVVSSETVTTGPRPVHEVRYAYFEVDRDGLITIAPHGHAKDWKPGKVTDIAEAVERFATPVPEARPFP